MASREYLYIVEESAFGTPAASPVVGTNAWYIRLTDGNSFNMSAAPVFEQIMYGGGLATPGEQISDHYALTGQLKTKLYPSQAAFLLGWGTTRVNSGGTAPWTTTIPVGDLASCSVYHGIQQSDGTYKRRRYAGTKVSSVGIEVSRDSTTASLTLGLIGAQQFGFASESTVDPTSTEFPFSDTHYPSGPYTFSSTAGGVTVGSVRSAYSSLAINIQNALDGAWFETQHYSLIQFCGRQTSVDLSLLFKPAPDDRATYEAITAQTASVVFASAVTGQTMTLTMNGNNVVTELPYDLPLDKHFEQKLKLMNNFDTSASEDFHIAFS